MDTIEDISSIRTDLIQEINRTNFAYNWKLIPPNNLLPSLQNTAHRLNGLGDNFYFIKIILRKNRLSNSFHRQYCNALQCWSLKEVFEVPRDHFKTTIGSVGMPIWWALPFNDRDEKLMRALGYGDEWIDWMHRAHDQNTRTLIAMEVIKNAWKVGKKISGEYKNNNFFKQLFPEILPDSSCQWTADTMTHKRDFTHGDANQGEGTYEFTGVDAALQSKHYRRLVFDDLYGKDAIKSELIATSTWEWVQLAIGAFDSDPNDPDMECDEVVNGNRWSFHDLNWKIKKELPYFRFHTHDAEGGCCDLHPPGVPIFPEEWSMAKLARMRQRLGEYFYSCFPAKTPILMTDLSERSIEDIKIGDEVVGYDFWSGYQKRSYNKLVHTKVVAINKRRSIIQKVITDAGRIFYCTPDHRWWDGRGFEIGRNHYRKLTLNSPITSVYTPYNETNIKDFIYLCCMLDGEGSFKSANLSISQSKTKHPEICDKIEQVLNNLNIKFSYRNDSESFVLCGGRSLLTRLAQSDYLAKINECRDKFWDHSNQIAENGGRGHKVVNIELLDEQDVYNIETESGNYVAWGYATKNCQFRNKPIPPGGNTFKTEWLKRFAFKTLNVESVSPGFKNEELSMNDLGTFGTETYKIIPHDMHQMKRHMAIRHEVQNGLVRKDIPTSYLSKMLMLDPNHAGEQGRANHALMLLGFYKDPVSLYILDGKADTCSREDIIHHAFVMAEKWRIHEIWVEISMGQTWCKTAFELESVNRRLLGKWYFHKVNPFKDNRSENAKSDRIEDTEPYFRRGQVWICSNDQTEFTNKFLEEYNEYPHCATRDILDILGHGVQNLQFGKMNDTELTKFVQNQQSQQMTTNSTRNSITGY